MSLEENKALVRRFIEEVINQGNLAALDDLLATNYRYHAPDLEVSGAEGMEQVFTMLRTAFQSGKETLDDLIAEEDKVVFCVTGHGTHRGAFYGIPPTGKLVAMQGIDIIRIEGVLTIRVMPDDYGEFLANSNSHFEHNVIPHR